VDGCGCVCVFCFWPLGGRPSGACVCVCEFNLLKTGTKPLPSYPHSLVALPVCVCVWPLGSPPSGGVCGVGGGGGLTMCCSSSCSSGVISLVVVHESADIVYPLPTHSLTLSLSLSLVSLSRCFVCVSVCVSPR
jgi:hypothetical protein